MKKQMFAGVCALVTAAAFGVGDEVQVIEGVHGVMSPDGSRIAFQRPEGDHMSLGVCDATGGAVTWVERGEGCAAFPVWSADGAYLFYAYGDREHTAYQNWVTKEFQEGYTIRRWTVGGGPGGTDVLARGLGIDATPSLDPDGTTLWFCSNKPWKKYGTDAATSNPADWTGNRICRSTLGNVQSGRWLIDYNFVGGVEQTSFASPSVSPDGKVLMWAELKRLVDYPWGIYLASAAAPGDYTLITPPRMSAYAPSWSPDGQHIVFTGYSYGSEDPGWCVYIQNPRQQWLKRLCPGENATFATDGQGHVTGIVYDLNGFVCWRTLSAGDFPTASDAIIDCGDGFHPWTETESVKYTKSGSNLNVTDATIKNDSKLAFGSMNTMFCRVQVVPTQNADHDQQLICLAYSDSGQVNADKAVQMFLTKTGGAYFSVRTPSGSQEVCYSDVQVPVGQSVVLTGIRSGKKLWLSVGNAAPGPDATHSKGQGNYQTLNVPASLKIKVDSSCVSAISKVEIGAGWPSNVPRPKMEGVDGFDWSKVNGGAQ